MTRPPAEVGMPVAEIDTPALVVDLDAYERNLDRMAGWAARARVRLRPHAKTHKCPVIALHQIARGAVGVCCQKVMDVDYKRVEGFPAEFENALFVLATIMSRPTRDRAVLDAGLKALGVDAGFPLVQEMPEVEYVRASDEHGKLRLHDPEATLRVGDKLWLIPGHCDPTINLYDWYVCVRGGRVEALWPITARGAVL